jgi:hypothetical protein
VHEAGLLAVIASSVLGTFLLLSPVSMLCYAVGAPVAVFSGAFVIAVLGGLAYCVRVRADRTLIAGLRGENPIAWLALAGLLWLQVRIGAYFQGDATFHLGRIRVLLDHGFTNRDIYLAEYHFQHIYHTNLLFPIYASASQLAGQSYLAVWFHSQAFVKLFVAAGHYVLAYAVTQRKLPAWLLALGVITANAGESYTTYPNTVAVGWLLPMQLAAAFTLLTQAGRPRHAVVVATCSFVTAQVHALYAVYAGLAMGPGLLVLALSPWTRGRRRLIARGLIGAMAAVPFLLVSQFAFRPRSARTAEEGPQASAASIWRSTAAAQAGPADAAPASVEPPKWLPEVDKGKPIVPTPAVAVGGGHLEKSLELDKQAVQVWMAPEKMGGKAFVALGFVGFVLAILAVIGRRRSWERELAWERERALPLLAAALGAASLGVILFWPPATTFAVALLNQPFTVARLSTVLSSLLMLGIAAGVNAVVEIAAHAGRRRWFGFVLEALAVVMIVGAATRLTGHAPMFFSEVVDAAMKPQEARYATLHMLEARREMLGRVVPAGTTVLTTARFARFVVMLCDCYVIIADRGHTYIPFARERREQLLLMNGANTPWRERAELLRRYRLKLVVFESRYLARLYRWSHEHGRVVGKAAGLEVVELSGS